jgi:hypothetical protein
MAADEVRDICRLGLVEEYVYQKEDQDSFQFVLIQSEGAVPKMESAY